MELLILIAVVGLGVAAFKLLGRPHTAIEIRGGVARVTRGAPPGALVSDLEELARHAPDARGVVGISGSGPRAEVVLRGFDEPIAQRVRNVVGLHRARLR